MNAVGNPNFKMSNKMIKVYQDKLAKLVPASSDLMENYFTINSEIYDDFCGKFEEKYAEKLNKICDAIKEADRQAYFSYQKEHCLENGDLTITRMTEKALRSLFSKATERLESFLITIIKISAQK